MYDCSIKLVKWHSSAFLVIVSPNLVPHSSEEQPFTGVLIHFACCTCLHLFTLVFTLCLRFSFTCNMTSVEISCVYFLLSSRLHSCHDALAVVSFLHYFKLTWFVRMCKYVYCLSCVCIVCLIVCAMWSCAVMSHECVALLYNKFLTI